MDSVAIKQRAFDVCFKPFAADRERIRAYCHGNNHTPRAAKFRHVYEHILRQRYTPGIAQRLHRCFERETTEQIVRAPAVPGAVAFLRWARSHGRTALLSSTPHRILLQILGRRGWQGQFDWVRGAPVNKAVWLKRMSKNRRNVSPLLFFGDTPEDASAAQRAGCRFVRVCHPREGISSAGIAGFSDLFAVLKKTGS